MTPDYALALPGFISMHYRRQPLLLRDGAGQRDPKLDALARSGDYFVTLATTLENLASELPETSIVTSGLALSKLADELLYVQRHYKVVAKQHPDRLTELG